MHLRLNRIEGAPPEPEGTERQHAAEPHRRQPGPVAVSHGNVLYPSPHLGNELPRPRAQKFVAMSLASHSHRPGSSNSSPSRIMCAVSSPSIANVLTRAVALSDRSCSVSSSSPATVGSWRWASDNL